MKKEFEQKLMDRFSFMEARNVFTGVRMGFPIGCDCGDGWFQIIWDLCEKIEKEVKNIVPDEQNLFLVEQIKEKFGGLRYYTSIGTEEMFDAIDEAERKSLETCEKCGNLGTVRNVNWWLTTLCDACYNETKGE